MEKSNLLSDAEFTRLTALVHERWGLNLTERKRTLVENRLSKLLRKAAFASVTELMELATTEGVDRLDVFDVLSTNHTSFYRESTQFDCLVERVLRPAMERRERRLRIWSAACSNGSEPYTIGMVLCDHLSDIERWDVRVLATDLSESSLATARRAVYTQKAVSGVPPEGLRKHFSRHGEDLVLRDHVRRLVTFGVVNLVGPWNMRGPFDAIFCRNVMIYFDPETRRTLVDRLKSLLRLEGILFVGCSESLSGQVEGLSVVAPGSSRRVAA